LLDRSLVKSGLKVNLEITMSPHKLADYTVKINLLILLLISKEKPLDFQDLSLLKKWMANFYPQCLYYDQKLVRLKNN